MTPRSESDSPRGLSLRVRVEGRVQGVGYRDACVREARALGLQGWVRNRRDGSVELLVHGAAESVDRMLAWLHVGPPLASVVRVTSTPQDAQAPEIRGFERRPTQ
jgi:acylphosphatase